ncbi:MAG: 3-hydroxybutyryl-CoA dehydrogenase [Bacteroidota bacterium]|nr:3-hydroxybutyryl-CoA dehydrogenase [Bacteroidota bacterium]MDP4230874.1 3-hydroxybutyryl-CoA dehydrogenase [Bacteroidota bacterium]MDP4237028.1 3-hydroxybutyryl-CoA dehydrogenase [Bacteroidota bacterium]
MSIQKVTVIGAGTMGNGIAHVFAQSGFDVTLVDIKQEFLDKALETIKGNLARQVKKGSLTEADSSATVARIKTSVAMDEAAKGSDFIVEAATENYELKKKIFATLDANAQQGVILATNTSSISVTELAATTKRAERVIGMHFFNPVPVMKLIEIIRGIKTTDEVYAEVKALSEKLGKTPVEVNDFPGFVSNRILMPMINEAIYCVMEGVAKPEDIDTVMKLGMAHPMGPLALADFIGLDVCLAIMNVLHEGLGDSKYRPSPLLKKMVAAGMLGKKSGQGFYKY